MSDEHEIEQAIEERGLNGPRVRRDDIDAAIRGVTYTLLPSGKVMVCEITLRNGFTVRGESATVSPENFDLSIGEKVSFTHAREKIWELEGYLLQERLYREQVAAGQASE